MNATIQEFHRPIPALPWNALACVALVLVTLAVVGWEWHCRALGYAPGLDDTSDLWVENRRHVMGDSTIIIGASRSLFGLDLNELEKGLGRRPVQLSLVGSCVYPILQYFADDKEFHGTVICDVVPGLLTVPPFAPPYHNSEKALERLRTQSIAQRWSHELSIPLERTFACLQQEDLTLSALLRELPIPNRPKAQIAPALPPYFSVIERDRNTKMADRVLTDQALCDRIKYGWLPLFTPPPKPHWIPDAAFGGFIHQMLEDRFASMAKAVEAIRARGGKVVFVHMPSVGELKKLEDTLTPRAAVWDRLLQDTHTCGIYSDDYPELIGLSVPEWSHLSAKDAVIFTRRLIPHLRKALDMQPQ